MLMHQALKPMRAPIDPCPSQAICEPPQKQLSLFLGRDISKYGRPYVRRRKNHDGLKTDYTYSDTIIVP